MSQTAERVRWTTRDLEVLPQSEGTRYELINGELFVIRSSHRRHQQISGKIFAAVVFSVLSQMVRTLAPPIGEKRVVLQNLTWEDYQQVLHAFPANRTARLTIVNHFKQRPLS